MIQIENIQSFGFESAIRGMRNPFNSWAKSDSDFSGETPVIGENDLDLAKRLIAAGSPDRKFLRMIYVSMDIVAPLYWWKEYDTYKVATVANSCSTMHKIQAKEFTLSDFSTEHLSPSNLIILDMVIAALNNARLDFNDNKDKRDWWQMIQLLPSSYNQRRTVSVNYETLRGMYYWRKKHKLDEWRTFCETIARSLPYAADLIVS